MHSRKLSCFNPTLLLGCVRAPHQAEATGFALAEGLAGRELHELVLLRDVPEEEIVVLLHATSCTAMFSLSTVNSTSDANSRRPREDPPFHPPVGSGLQQPELRLSAPASTSISPASLPTEIVVYSLR